MWKVYGQTDRRTMDERRSEKLTSAFGSGELKKLRLNIYHGNLIWDWKLCYFDLLWKNVMFERWNLLNFELLWEKSDT